MKQSHKHLIIPVCAGDHQYSVVIDNGIPSAIYKQVIVSLKPNRLFVFFDATFYALHGKALNRSLQQTGRPVISVVLPSGERHKTIKSVTALHAHLIANQISRDDLIVACGGGVTSDIVGFAASTVLRGVRWGICATTLLSMVDASVGGKTGVNHPDGKNMIGSFWQPSFVIDDLKWLETLPTKEYRSGMAEVIKTAGLAGGRLLSRLAQVGHSLEDADQSDVVDLVSGTIAFKAMIVGSDERDGGIRLCLNFGHTIGHAIEQSLGFKRLAHGEAVILGMIGAMEIAERLKLSQSNKLNEFKRIVLRALANVPTVQLDPKRILGALALDKKRTSKGIQFVLLSEPGKPIVKATVSKREITAAIEAMIRVYRAK